MMCRLSPLPGLLQCVAVCGSVLQCVAVHCIVLHVCCSWSSSVGLRMKERGSGFRCVVQSGFRLVVWLGGLGLRV